MPVRVPSRAAMPSGSAHRSASRVPKHGIEAELEIRRGRQDSRDRRASARRSTTGKDRRGGRRRRRRHDTDRRRRARGKRRAARRARTRDAEPFRQGPRHSRKNSRPRLGSSRQGHTRRVDLGEVNDEIFINNSSLGIYPYLVADRERQRSRGRAVEMGRDYAGISPRAATISDATPHRSFRGRRGAHPHPLPLHRQQRISADPARFGAAQEDGRRRALALYRQGRDPIRFLWLAFRLITGMADPAADLATGRRSQRRNPIAREPTSGCPGRRGGRPCAPHCSIARGRAISSSSHPGRRCRREALMRTVAHLSDLHFGRHDPAIVEALIASLRRKPARSGDRQRRSHAACATIGICRGAHVPRPHRRADGSSSPAITTCRSTTSFGARADPVQAL